MFKIKFEIVTLTILIVVTFIYFKTSRSLSNANALEVLLGFSTVFEIEKFIGKPCYVFDSQGQFGKSLMSHSDFENGITIRVYLLNKTVPKFFVVKVSKNRQTVMASIIENS